LAQRLHKPLIETPKNHAAIIGAEYAKQLGLPVRICDPASDQWRQIWELYVRYYPLDGAGIYENKFVSAIVQREDAGQA